MNTKEIEAFGPATREALAYADKTLIPKELKLRVAQEMFQPVVDEMLGTGQFAQYVKQHKLSLIGGAQFADIDRLLDAGILRDHPEAN